MTPHQMTTVRRCADAGAENYMGGVGTAYAATDRQIGRVGQRGIYSIGVAGEYQNITWASVEQIRVGRIGGIN